MRGRRASRAGPALGEGKESTGATTTHLRTTHDRERLCAWSGCGRKNDVRHDRYPTPLSPKQCKPAIRLIMGAAHRRITAEPIPARCRVDGVSDVRGDEPHAPQARWRQLVPTPVAQDGGPLRTTPAWWPHAPSDAGLAAVAASGTPVLGDSHVVNGVEMVEATFLWRDDQQHGASPSVLIHLNTLTDNHRTHIAPAIAARVPGTGWWALHVLLPQDALLGYRTVVTRDPLPDDAGAQRESWKRVHALGRPDPFNSDSLHDGFGLVSSMWQGPKALLHPDWRISSDAPTDRAPICPRGERDGYDIRFDLEDAALRDFDEPHDPRRRVTLWRGCRVPESSGGRCERGLLVLLDGNIWRGNDAVDHLAPRSSRWDLLLIDSGGLAMRSRDLSDPRRSRELLRRCLQAARRATGDRDSATDSPSDGGGEYLWPPQRIVVAGQSLGGVAAADFVLHRPELATRAVVQSGSFWLGSDHRGEGEGDVLTWLRRRAETRRTSAGSWEQEDLDVRNGGSLKARMVVQCGVHESGLQRAARTAAALLKAEGTLVEYWEERGGHDYAWWRHGLSWGLDAHEQDLDLSDRTT